MEFKERIKQILSDINWKLILTLSLVPWIDFFITKEKPSLASDLFTEAVWETLLLICIGVFISHRLKADNRAKQSLEESETKIRTITESAKDAIIIIDPNENVSYWNPAAEKIFGYKKEEIIGKNTWEHLAPERDRGFHHSNYKKFQETGFGEVIGKTVELTAIRKDGTEFQMELSSSILKLMGKINAIAIVRDITERKLAEEARRESELRLCSIYESSPIGILITKRDGTLQSANPAVYKILGYTEAELLKMKFADISHSGELEENLKYFKEMIEGKRNGYQMEKRYYRKDGSIMWGNLTTVAIRDGKGNYLYNYAMIEDITERKQSEKQFEKNERLESLGILAGGIAHDFNNLFGAILGNIELAARIAEKDSKQYRYLTESREAILRAKDITQQLLTFSKGGAPIKSPESIEKIIRDSSDFVLHGSNTKIVYHFDEDLDLAEVDAGQLSQVIQNLVINADQAMPKGGTAFITAENHNVFNEASSKAGKLKAGRYIKVTIKDEGIGIPENHIKNIFDPYFSTKQKGSGLGLAIVYSIIKAHGGDIDVESTLGAGTVFTLYLPSVERKEAMSIKKTADYSKGFGERILLIEDDKNVANTMAAVLEELGYKSETAYDGESAVELYKRRKKEKTPFSLVITDLTIPGGMGGDDANKMILAFDPTAKTIATSGYSNDPILSDYKEYGYAGALKKPIKFDEIGLIIHNVLRNG